jgi:hypothetical protein
MATEQAALLFLLSFLFSPLFFLISAGIEGRVAVKFSPDWDWVVD